MSSFTSLKGQLLLDGGKLAGSFFHRTVVLICQHDADGAFGLVLNRSTDNSVGEVLVADLPESLKRQPVYLGGPVQPGALSYLHVDPEPTESTVIPNLVLGHSLDTLIEIAEVASNPRRLRVFAGYAGWSPGQLEDEMKRESWLVHPAALELVFRADVQSLWPMILGQKGWQYRLLSQAPDDLSSN